MQSISFAYRQLNALILGKPLQIRLALTCMRLQQQLARREPPAAVHEDALYRPLALAVLVVAWLASPGLRRALRR